MIYNFNDAQVHFELIKGRSEKVLIYLHGWGRSGKDFKKFVDVFEEYSILLIDFPPFGKSKFNPQNFSIFSYANIVIGLCEHLNISTADFIGHSFGGRVCLIISALKPSLVHKCIYVDSAGMKPRRGIKYYAKVWKYKLCRKLGKTTHGGSDDYRALSPEMRGLFNNIVNTHLEEFAKEVVSPSLIVWGEKDDQTPLYMGKRINRLIDDSKFEVIKNAGHFSLLDSPLEFASIVLKFLKEN
ncbi:MAG: alpha/beta hydrolase [Clostridia bacterium]|nr:alpha/beta hydrolase [Clostridia bacterium]MBQ8792545.1 alpha/beta hydrolase [Clostridia bacterium]